MNNHKSSFNLSFPAFLLATCLFCPVSKVFSASNSNAEKFPDLASETQEQKPTAEKRKEEKKTPPPKLDTARPAVKGRLTTSPAF